MTETISRLLSELAWADDQALAAKHALIQEYVGELVGDWYLLYQERYGELLLSQLSEGELAVLCKSLCAGCKNNEEASDA